MTGPDNTNTTLLSDKLSLVTHHHLLTRVPVKLEFDDWNYGSWEFFFDQLCDSYDVSKYIHGNPSGTATSNPPPLTPEELKVDKIILSWIFSTLSDPLQKRLVIARSKSAKEAWDFISDLVEDNKHSRTSPLKAELRSVKLGDLSMEAYFQKIESLMTILASLDSPVSDEDVVHYVIDGLPEKYNQVCGYMHYKDTFPDFKTARSLLITKEIRLMSKSLASPVDSSSSSPMVLLADSGVHDNGTYRDSNTTPTPSNHVAYTATVTPAPLYYSAQQVSPYSAQSVMTQPAHYVAPPPSFAYPPAHHQLVQQLAHPTAHASLSAVPAIPYQPAQSPNVQPYPAHGISVAGSVQQAQPSALPGAWHMDTGSSSHLNNSVTSLTTIFNSCMYPSVSVGDGHSISVTNSGHSILPTTSRSLHLNNVLITPHIVKNLISVRQFVRDNHCTIEFDSFGFSAKDFLTRLGLLRCDSTRDLYPVTAPSPIAHAFLVSQHT
ncbi:ribonuclease H-like domain-containing protein [Tanacetum coccineum]|uniref:Ribonuclease H-like domain-containing protein n=1 Tax=Tanacetum coccineum TaxID=301880 RepID=A0ABQ5IIL8_9ASTR